MGDSMTLTQADFDALQDERDLERAAYEARISELEATVARVKAESLRVVACDSKETSPLEAIFTHGGCVVRDANGKFYQLSRGATELPDGLSARTGVFVVHLEHWEEQE